MLFVSYYSAVAFVTAFFCSPHLPHPLGYINLLVRAHPERTAFVLRPSRKAILHRSQQTIRHEAAASAINMAIAITALLRDMETQR
jgi:hypothetical protein